MGHEQSPQQTDTAPRRHSDDWFDRELAQLNAQLDDIAAWLKTRPATPVPLPPWRPSAHATAGEPAEPSIPIGRGLAASAQTGEPASEAAVAASGREAAAGTAATPDRAPNAAAGSPAAPAPAEPPRPTGTDLSDPKNFGLLPPVAELEQGTASAEDYRQRLGKHLAFATTVLHTSKVPAAVWREWRAFERAIHDRLLALSATPSDSPPR